jgi:hypothetical protein
MLTASDYIRRLDVVNRGFRYVFTIQKMRTGTDTSKWLQHSSGARCVAQYHSFARRSQNSFLGTTAESEVCRACH